MYTISQLTNMIGFWLDVLQHHGAAPLLGDSGPCIMDVVAKHGMQVANQWNSQYYLEMPLMGKAGADCSISCRYVSENWPYSCYWEFDTSKGKTTDPSLFLEVRQPVFRDWSLIQIGLMTGRKDAPNRLVFQPVGDDSEGKMAWSVASVDKLLQRLKWGTLPVAFAEKLRDLEALKWQKIFIHVDRMQDGSWGDTLGVDILGWIPGTEPDVFFQQEKTQKLLMLLSEWGMADGREKILPSCVGAIPLPEVLGFPRENYLLSMCSHFKLRYNKDGWLPAKVYLHSGVFIND